LLACINRKISQRRASSENLLLNGVPKQIVLGLNTKEGNPVVVGFAGFAL
jgi:hypothetical protein